MTSLSISSRTAASYAFDSISALTHEPQLMWRSTSSSKLPQLMIGWAVSLLYPVSRAQGDSKCEQGERALYFSLSSFLQSSVYVVITFAAPRQRLRKGRCATGDRITSHSCGTQRPPSPVGRERARHVDQGCMFVRWHRSLFFLSSGSDGLKSRVSGAGLLLLLLKRCKVRSRLIIQIEQPIRTDHRPSIQEQVQGRANEPAELNTVPRSLSASFRRNALTMPVCRDLLLAAGSPSARFDLCQRIASRYRYRYTLDIIEHPRRSGTASAYHCTGDISGQSPFHITINT